MGSLVLDSLAVRGFRTFRSLNIERLARVTLLAGRNGVGKSFVLDAVRFYARRGLPGELLDQLAARNELARLPVVRPRWSDDWRDRAEALRCLFYGWPLLGARPSFTVKGSAGDVVVQVVPREDLPGQLALPLAGDTAGTGDLALGIWADRPTAVLLDRLFDPRTGARYETGSTDGTRVLTIGAQGLDEERAATLFDAVWLDHELKEEALRALSLVHADVEEVNFASSHRPDKARSAEARVRGGGRVSLAALGEGAPRLLNIALAMANAADGLALIDEVDRGLHHSVHADLWGLVLRLAARLNVQVVATTHSRDCIDGLAQALTSDLEADGLLVRLDRQGDHHQAVTYDRRRLSIAATDHIEVR